MAATPPTIRVASKCRKSTYVNLPQANDREEYDLHCKRFCGAAAGAKLRSEAPFPSQELMAEVVAATDSEMHAVEE
eukprot:3579982-Rhodomonas_salina.1